MKFRGILRTSALHSAEPELVAWLEKSRLNLTRGMGERASDQRLQSALARFSAKAEPALKKTDALLDSSVGM